MIKENKEKQRKKRKRRMTLDDKARRRINRQYDRLNYIK